jgi:hypothetical protein
MLISLLGWDEFSVIINGPLLTKIGCLCVLLTLTDDPPRVLSEKKFEVLVFLNSLTKIALCLLDLLQFINFLNSSPV